MHLTYMAHLAVQSVSLSCDHKLLTSLELGEASLFPRTEELAITRGLLLSTAIFYVVIGVSSMVDSARTTCLESGPTSISPL